MYEYMYQLKPENAVAVCGCTEVKSLGTKLWAVLVICKQCTVSTGNLTSKCGGEKVNCYKVAKCPLDNTSLFGTFNDTYLLGPFPQCPLDT